MAYCIRLVAETAAPAKKEAAVEEPFRRYRDPSAEVAQRQPVPVESLLQGDGAAAAGAGLLVILLPAGTPEGLQASAQRWLAAAGRPVAARGAGLSLSFLPGAPGQPDRAVIAAPAEMLDEAIAAVTDLWFYEGQLRKLEAEIAQEWTEVEADLPHVSKLDDGSRKLWPALYRKLAHQHRLSMAATRIDHRIALLTDARSPELSKLLGRLRARARLPTRIEQLHNHLEVRDGVYDQIGYRLSDHRQMRASLVIEVIIVVLLLMEVGISLFNLLSGEK